MMRKYGLVIVAGTLMAVVLGVFFTTYHNPIIEQLTFTEQVCGMDLKLFHDEKDDKYYLFIPAYADKEHISINKPDGVNVRLVANGQDCGTSLVDLPLNEPVEFTISPPPPYNRTESYTIELLQSKNIPAILIETGAGGLEYVHLRKENETQVSVVVINSEGEIEYTGLGNLSGRGNSTFGQAKRPYNIKFRQPTSIHNNEIARTWCLLANYSDDSQIRNAICYHIAQKVGIPYTSTIDFVSLYINGAYQGLYNLASKEGYMIDKDNKVSAVFERSASSRVYDRISNNNFYIRTRYGDSEQIVKFVNAFEDALYSDTISYQGLAQYIDLHSISLKILVDVLCANSSSVSQYYMLDNNGKIHAICAWDYDLSFGVTWYYPDFNYNQMNLEIPWFKSLFAHKEFREELISFLQKYSKLLQEDIITYEDSICMVIENDWQMDSQRWCNSPSFGNGETRLKSISCDLKSLKGHVNYIETFMTKRVDFLKKYLSNPEIFSSMNFYTPCNEVFTLYCSYDDTLTTSMLPDGLLTMPDEGFEGWYTADGTSIMDVGVITEDMSFAERLTPKSHTTALMEKVIHKAWLLILIAVFGCLSLWLFVKAVIIPIKEAKG